MGYTIGLVCPYSFSRPGGVQNHVMGLAGWLTGQGHRVAVLGPGIPDATALARSGLGADQFTSTGPAVPVPYNGSVARISFGPLETMRVRAWLHRLQPDVLHLHEPVTPSISLLSLWQSSGPVVATFHTATPGSSSMSAARRLLAGSIASIDVGIAVSSVARQVVRDHLGLDPVVIGNGIGIGPRPGDLERTSWRGGDHPRITFVGRYDEPRKGFDVFAQALPLIRQRLGGTHVMVVGEGTPRPLPGVDFLGCLDDTARDAVLGSTDVYVAPHIGRESFGIVLLEALAAGADVVASSLPAFAEVLTDDQQALVGTLAPIGDAGRLADQVVSVLEHPSVARRLAGWQHAASFDWDVLGSRIGQIYEQVISAHDVGIRRGR
ncbi:glycosyltransferase family 4 protein [Tessaracoccus sp. SD287]|uniref:glycosyltransferase family 4 protein n=1 Tax=Tessaracoccus sp. SD287 TaxID=2782008 RepID=UPI001A957B8B|nr:glycosyltransferase family 4 protein [Tessaracoccus sp. SD287]MBO1029766.1 glycosyltransferase family 4 protein [Tessaracoccus sp. SD287]